VLRNAATASLTAQTAASFAGVLVSSTWLTHKTLKLQVFHFVVFFWSSALAGEVTVGLAESTGNIHPGLLLWSRVRPQSA